MLWQPSLPATYTRATPGDLADRIGARRRELGSALIILAHHYQADEVIRHADFTGDSLKLAQLAAERVEELGARWVVFCGVHFMAETADLLTPDSLAVILPDLSAGCSMADMADHDDAAAAWENIHAALHEQGWRGRIVPVTYINSTAAIKAFVAQHGGAVCTSGNAARVMEWALAGGTRPRRARENIKALFLPDQHLGRNTAAALGIEVTTGTCLYDPRKAAGGHELGGAAPKALLDASVILWAGHCSVHKLFRAEHCHEARRDRLRVLVHPECCKEVVDLADLAGSTEFIIRTIRAAPAGSRWAVGTEVHLVTRLAREAAARGVHVRILSDCQCLCTTMYRIDQAHLCWALDNLAAGDAVNRVSVPPTIRAGALAALRRMLDLAPTPALVPNA